MMTSRPPASEPVDSVTGSPTVSPSRSPSPSPSTSRPEPPIQGFSTPQKSWEPAGGPVSALPSNSPSTPRRQSRILEFFSSPRKAPGRLNGAGDAEHPHEGQSEPDFKKPEPRAAEPSQQEGPLEGTSAQKQSRRSSGSSSPEPSSSSTQPEVAFNTARPLKKVGLSEATVEKRVTNTKRVRKKGKKKTLNKTTASQGPSHGSDKGKEYEYVLHTLVAVKAYSIWKDNPSVGHVGQTFEEPGMGPQLDDLALRFGDSVILVQSKHQWSPKKFPLAVLRGGQDGKKDFSLSKFLASYIQSKDKVAAETVPKEIKHILLFTNRPLSGQSFTYNQKTADFMVSEIDVDTLPSPLQEIFDFRHDTLFKFTDSWIKSEANSSGMHTYKWVDVKASKETKVEFLEKFIFAMSQPGVKKLKQKIISTLQELKNKHKSLEALEDLKQASDTLMSQVNARVRANDGTKSPGQLEWTIQDTERELNFLVVGKTSSATQSLLLDQGVQLKLTPDSPRPFLDTSRRLIILTKQLYACAQLAVKAKKADGYIFLTAEEFRRFVRLTGVSRCISTNSKTLILIHDNNAPERVSLPDLSSEVLIEIDSDRCQVILLTNDEDHANQEGFTTFTHDLKSSDLHIDTVHQILELNIKFQGRSCKVRDIIPQSEDDRVKGLRVILDPETIEKVVKGESVDVGSDVEDRVKDRIKMGSAAYNEDFYIERRLRQSIDDAPQLKHQRIKSKKKKNPHAHSEHRVIDDAMRGGKPVIVNAPPGMGKSTLLKRVCVTIKTTHHQSWVLFCDLKNDRERRRTLLKDIDMNNLTLQDLASPTSKMSLLLRGLFPEEFNSQLELNIFAQKSENLGEVVMLFDSFDEIEELFGEKFGKNFANFVEKLSSLVKPVVWIMTRKPAKHPHLTNLKEREIYDLQGLTTEQQEHLLMKLKIEGSEATARTLSRFHKSFLQNPLHLTMISEVLSKLNEHGKENLTTYTLYEDFVDQKITSFVSPLLKHPDDDDCERLIEYLRPKVISDHQQIAMVVKLGDDWWRSLTSPIAGSLDDLVKESRKANFGLLRDFKHEVQTTEKVYTSWPCYIYGVVPGFGLVQEIKHHLQMPVKVPTFVHETYADFFLSTFLYQKREEIPTNELLCSLVKSLLDDEELLETWSFLDDKLYLDFLRYHPSRKWIFSRRDLRYGSDLVRTLTVAELPTLSCFLWNKRDDIFRGDDDEKVEFMENLFISAVACCNVGFVEEVVYYQPDSSVDLNIVYEGGITALHVACDLTLEDNDEGESTAVPQTVYDIQMYLVGLLTKEIGNDVNAKTDDGETAFHIAARHANQVVVECLERDWNIDVNAVTDAGQTMLHLAAESETDSLSFVQWLLKKGCDVRVVDEDGWTALHFAALQGNLAVAEVLLNEGCGLETQANDGMTALHVAAEQGDQAMVGLLQKRGGDLNSRTNDGRTAIHFAAACETDSRGLVEFLLREGCSVDTSTDAGLTPLHFASMTGSESVIELLTKKGAYVNAASHDRRTAIHFAAARGVASIVKLLLDKHCSRRALTSDMETVLHFAARRGSVPVLKLLIRKGCNVDARNTHGETALHVAAQRGLKPVIRHLLLKTSNIRAVSNDGWNALHYAAERGSKPIVTLLLTKVFDLNAKTAGGWTALTLAAKAGSLPVVKLLLDKHCDVNTQTDDGWTALHFAACSGKLDMIRLLLSQGCNIDARTNAGWTAYNLAETWGKQKLSLVQFLLDNNCDDGHNFQ